MSDFKETANKVRESLKSIGLNSRKVSVRANAPYGINVEIKDPEVSLLLVQSLVGGHEVPAVMCEHNYHDQVYLSTGIDINVSYTREAAHVVLNNFIEGNQEFVNELTKADSELEAGYCNSVKLGDYKVSIVAQHEYNRRYTIYYKENQVTGYCMRYGSINDIIEALINLM